ncbi:hypothetical protein ADK34_23710, partial [Streptomyces viridochromogenes]
MSTDRTDTPSGDSDTDSELVEDASNGRTNDSASVSTDRTDAPSGDSGAVSDVRPSGTFRETVSGVPPAGADVLVVPASALAVAGTPSGDDTGTPVPAP